MNRYAKRKSLIIHYKQHPGFCHDCGLSNGGTPEDVVKHNEKHHISDYPHICKVCGESFSRNQQFLVHLEAHNKQPILKYTCNRCGEKFITAKQFKDHLQTMGHQEVGRVCEYCGKDFVDEPCLKQHLKRVHKKGMATLSIFCYSGFWIFKEYLINENLIFRLSHEMRTLRSTIRYSTEFGTTSEAAHGGKEEFYLRPLRPGILYLGCIERAHGHQT